MGIGARLDNELETDNEIDEDAGENTGEEVDVDVDEAEQGNISLHNGSDEHVDVGGKIHEERGEDVDGDTTLVASVG